MPLDLTSIPLIDNHCHSLLRAQPHTADEWKQFFTESYFPEIVRDHVEHTLFYQWAQRELAEFYGCAPEAGAILAARAALPLDALTQKINHAANIRAWLVDYGYSTTQTYGHVELQSMTGARVASILRLEPLLEELVLQSDSFDVLHESFVHALHDLRRQGYVALKSILAYRAGLDLGPATRDDARAAFPALKARAMRDGKLRLASKPFLDYLIPLAVEIASRQEFPIQIHTGFGDPDQDLFKSNPAFLRPLLVDEKYRGAKIVLLHAAYPYARTLGYLAAAYPNVYADFGLAIPFVPGEARQILRELLGLAPASKVLYSSDAFHIPELYYLGAVLGRRALAEILDEFTTAGLLDPPTARAWAERILWRNAAQLYELAGL
jgi:hypothetical protein